MDGPSLFFIRENIISIPPVYAHLVRIELGRKASVGNSPYLLSYLLGEGVCAAALAAWRVLTKR